MNSGLILGSDLLDLLFEKRNKDYGAYQLRKFYNYRLIQSIGIMMLIVIVFSAFTFLPNTARQYDFAVTEQFYSKILPDTKISKFKPKRINPSTKRPVATLKLTNTIEIVPNKDSADVLANLNELSIGNNTNFKGDGILLAGTTNTVSEVNSDPAPTEPLIDKTKPVDFAEIMPEFPGGVQALRKFLMKNLINPRELEKEELINVKVRFVVGYDGNLQGFELIEDGGIEFNNEVMRVLKKMPSWKPGKTHGQNVSVYYIIPVKFIAQD